MQLLLGDSLEVLKTLPDNSVDSVVTDPPAGIGFMGKDWDHHKGGRDQWIAWLASILKECHRVLKPGGHALVWSIPRTSHWTGTACENAGFEVRDQISHIFGSGFPKSHNVSKAIDKEAGAEREVVAYVPHTTGIQRNKSLQRDEWDSGENHTRQGCLAEEQMPITTPATDLAKQWDGWGSALKPSREDWWLCRKPLSEKTLAQNVVKHGTGALNIDGCRIETTEKLSIHAGNLFHGNSGIDTKQSFQTAGQALGRFPSHTIFDEDAAQVLDEQSGFLHGAGNKRDKLKPSPGGYGSTITGEKNPNYHNDSGGGASRFFYCAKSSKSDRNSNGAINTHPTCKSTKLMEYLIKLITPCGGTVLDPFMGSGSTGVAAKNLGMQFIGIEREQEYFEIATARVG